MDEAGLQGLADACLAAARERERREEELAACLEQTGQAERDLAAARAVLEEAGEQLAGVGAAAAEAAAVLARCRRLEEAVAGAEEACEEARRRLAALRREVEELQTAERSAWGELLEALAAQAGAGHLAPGLAALLASERRLRELVPRIVALRGRLQRRIQGPPRLRWSPPGARRGGRPSEASILRAEIARLEVDLEEAPCAGLEAARAVREAIQGWRNPEGAPPLPGAEAGLDSERLRLRELRRSLRPLEEELRRAVRETRRRLAEAIAGSGCGEAPES